MKFFPELGLCFGSTAGASANQLAVETTTVTLPPLPKLEPAAEVRRLPSRRSNRRRLMKVHSMMQWKPELSAIAEERVVSDGRRKEELTSKSEKKAVVNKVEQTPAKRSSSSKYGNDYEYRKPCHRMVIPAFSPTPFVF